MIHFLLLVLQVSTVHAASQTEPINWAQPPVGCIEEVIPRDSDYPCPDLSQVADPTRDFPPSFTQQEIELWNRERARDLAMCRAHEIMRRENLKPGSFDAIIAERAWMRLQGAADSTEKADAIYDASEREGVPGHVLLGALAQESLVADLGISDDGGNFSCGIGQLNVLEWCRWADSQPGAVQAQMEWPTELSSAYKAAHGALSVCSAPLLATTLIKPFYSLGLKNLKGLPEYRLRPEHLRDISLSQVVGAFPEGSKTEQQLRYAIAHSFTQNCSDFRLAIPAKAHELHALYNDAVPEAMKQVQLYSSGERFERTCRRPVNSQYYPLHTGWLLADAAYNAGSRVVSMVTHYLRLTPESFAQENTWAQFRATDLISALFWAGKYNPKTDLIEFVDFSGKKGTITWFKSCVVQRHIARVVQYVTLPGHSIAESLEDKNGCFKSTFDSNGNLVKTSVPLIRQKSSGKIGRRHRTE